MIGKELVFFSFLYINLFELGVGVAFSNQSEVTQNKVNLLNSRAGAAALSAPIML